MFCNVVISGCLALNMAVSKKIVGRHGGCIWVESELGKGATCHFSIPQLSESLRANDENYPQAGQSLSHDQGGNAL